MNEHARITVLCVDDDSEYASLLGELLEAEDERFETTTATSAATGVERIETEGVDCVVSDYEMADTTGIEFLQTVRDRYGELPFILYTGEGGESVASDAISAGVTDYLQKDGDSSEYPILANRIDNAVTQYRAERTARRTQQRFRGLIERSKDLITVLDDDAVCQYQSPASERVLGYEPGELIGESVLSYIHPADRDRVTTAFESAMTGEGSPSAEYRFKHADGSWVWLDSVGNNQLDNPAIEGFVVNSRDITERREREAAIEELHAFTESFTAADSPEDVANTATEVVKDVLGLPVAAVYLHEDGRLVPAAGTDAATEMIGELPTFPAGDALAWEVFETGEPQMYDDVSEAPGRYNPETAVRAEVLLPLGGHGVLILASDESASFDETDRSLAQTVAVRTKTALDRVERESRLRTQKSRIESLHEVATDIEACDTADAVYERIIRAAEEILAFDVAIIDAREGDTLVPQAVSSHLSADDYHEETPIDAEDNFGARAYRTGESIVVDDITTHDVSPAATEFRSALTVPIGEFGVFQTVDRSVGAFDDDDLELVELLTAHAETRLTSIDNRRALADRTEELERQNERLEEFVGVVSHDLRSPLNVAQGRLSFAREETDSPHLDDAAAAVDRSLSLIEDLLALARQGERIDELEPVNLAGVSRRCWGSVQTEAATRAVETEQTIMADPNRLRQLLENLIRNAVDHAGSDVTVTVGAIPGEGFFVADDGPGLPDDESILQPGVSTADDGTGFGLSIVQEIADAHGWTVATTASADGGARIELRDVTITDDTFRE